METKDWVSLISVAFALSGLLAGAFAIIRSQLIKTRIEALEGLVNTQEKEIKGLERKNESQAKDLLTVHAELDAEKRKVRALEDLKTARNEILELTKLLTDKAKENNHDHEQIMAALLGIDDKLSILVKGGGNVR